MKENDKQITQKEFLNAVLSVAKSSNFENPKCAFWQCTEFSFAVASMAQELGLKVEVVSVWAEFQHSINEVSKGDVEGHTLLKIGDDYYDYTIRQIDPNQEFPFISRDLPSYFKKPSVLDVYSADDSYYTERLFKILCD